MQYLMMLCTDEAVEDAMDETSRKAMYQEYFHFTMEVRASGNYKGGSELQPVSTATTVRVRDGKTVATDGPFAETREQIGGYYLIEANDLDEAIAIASRIPAAKIGSVEIRPLMPMPEMPATV